MHVNCSTCLDLLTPSDDLSSAPCGHVFHSHCIIQWLETGKSNCPQCRTKCTERQLRRIFFTEGVDTSLSQQVDSDALQNRLDSLTFQLRCLENEKKQAKEQVDVLTCKNVALVDEVRQLEAKVAKAKEDCLMAKKQVKLMHGEKEKARLARLRVDELTNKLELYKTIEIGLEGTMPQMMDRLHTLNDYSENSKQLCQLAETLKKQLGDKRSEMHALHKALARKGNECGALKTKVAEEQGRVRELMEANNRLTADMEHAEEEKENLHVKLQSLQEAMTSPSGDPRTSALQRLIAETPAPAYVLNNRKSAGQDDLSPFLTTKSCSLVGLKQSQEPSASAVKRTNTTSASQPSSMFKKARPETGEMHYNGLGGHSKKDMFPDPNRVKVVGKKPKGVSRPGCVSSQRETKKLQTINKYFNFDTP